jgi:hypothetical protein
VRIHIVDNLDATVSIDLLTDALEDRRALASKGNRHSEVLPLVSGHGEHLLRDWFQELNAFQVGFNVIIVIMSLLVNTVETFFELVLSVSHESGVLRSPSGV